MSWVNHSRGKMALASSMPFPGQLQSSRPQLNRLSSLPYSFPAKKIPFLVLNGIYFMLQRCWLQLPEGKGTWKAWLRTQRSIAPGQVGTALTVSSLLGGHTAFQTVGLPPGGLYCLKKQDKKKEICVYPTAFVPSHLCQALILPSGIFSDSPETSYIGATSTRSHPTMFRLLQPRIISKA